MSTGVVYKQRYCSVSDKVVVPKNIAHFTYIATRPGTIYNPGCTFGVWGKIDGMQKTENINDLQAAQNRVKEISKQGKTMYRAVVSLEGQEAQEKGYVNREQWQKLITQKIQAIAAEKNMDIPANHFEWMASFHSEPEHPHCHIVFWDNSDSIRNEYIPPERFEIMAENIRAEFNREIYRDEISNLFKQSDSLKMQMKGIMTGGLSSLESMLHFHAEDYEDSPDTRELLCGAMLELNATGAIDTKFNPEFLKKLGVAIDRVIISLPGSGSLKYAYLPPNVKLVVDQLIDALLESTEFSKLKNQYISTSIKISELYGNGLETIEHNEEKALVKLYTEMGNSLMAKLKELGVLNLDTSRGLDYLNEIKQQLPEIATSKLVELEDYKRLEETIPELRLAMKRFMDKHAWSKMNSLVNQSISSPEVEEYKNLAIKLFNEEVTISNQFVEDFKKASEKMGRKLTLKDSGKQAFIREFSNFTLDDADTLISLFQQMSEINVDNPKLYKEYQDYMRSVQRAAKAYPYKAVITAAMQPIQQQISSTVMEQIKTKKGWYDFHDKVYACQSVEELEPLFDHIKVKVSQRFSDLIANDESVTKPLQNVIQRMPQHRQKFQTFFDEDFRQLMDKTTNSLLKDDLLCSMGFDYIDCKFKSFELVPPELPVEKEEAASEDEADPLKKLAYSCFYRQISSAIIDHCLEVKGWKQEYRDEVALSLAVGCFDLFSQSVNQNRNGLSLSGQARRLYSKDMSKRQRKELAKKLQGGSNSYEDEWAER